MSKKILLISPPFLPIKSDLRYGGTERVILGLYTQLREMGHECFIAAPSDSEIDHLLPTVPSIGVSSLYSPMTPAAVLREHTYQKLQHVARVLQICEKIDPDIIHSHDDYLLPFSSALRKPMVTTLHCCFYEEFWKGELNPGLVDEKTPLVALSKVQQELYSSHGWSVDFLVYNGIDINKYSLSSKKSDFLFSMAALLSHKGQREAILVAKKLGKNLILAGNIVDRTYYETQIAPHLTSITTTANPFEECSKILLGSNSKVIFVGELNDEQKLPFLQHAQVFLAPYFEDKSCPLAPLEAMACGTPVLAFRKGALPEIIVQGKTGFFVDSLDEMVEHVAFSADIAPKNCRDHVNDSFSLERMAQNYLRIYEEISREHKK